MLENLLFYTVLLQDVLPRLFRVDLAMPKNAYMLFRLSKVLNLPCLSNMIKDGKSQILVLKDSCFKVPLKWIFELGSAALHHFE